MNTHFLACGPKGFFCWSFCRWTRASHPQVLSIPIDGISPFQSSKGVLKSIADEGRRFIVRTRVLAAHGQEDGGSLDVASIAVMPSARVRFIRSATPFCCGVSRIVCSRSIPCAIQKSRSLCDEYSPPLSSRKHFTVLRIPSSSHF
jgi:hypothetical protein